jgi:glyceraldehyde-3-phosphate dehydrogenase type I
MTMKIGIIGLGRIGRTLLKQLVEAGHTVAAAWEPLAEAGDLAYLLTYDSIHGRTTFPVEADPGESVVYLNGNPCRIYSDIPDQSAGLNDVDVLVDCSGRDDRVAALAENLPANIRHLLISWLHPAARETIIFGVNDSQAETPLPRILSVGTCTGNCFLPILKILKDEYTVDGGILNILHPYLASQNLLDNPHPCGDHSFLRAAPLSVIPGKTRLLKSIDLVFPEYSGRFQAICYRVPAPSVLMLDANLFFDRPIPAQKLLETLQTAAETSHHGLITVCHDRVVSRDFTGSPWSAAVDAHAINPGTRSIHKIILWQDNEWGYCCRIVNILEQYLIE